MAKPVQATEVFRFVCARPAQKDNRSIIHVRLVDGVESTVASVGVSNRGLRYGSRILNLLEQLKLDTDPENWD
jgi:hypothetical protein